MKSVAHKGWDRELRRPAGLFCSRAGSWVRGESFLAQGDAVQFALHRRHQGAAAAKGQKPLEAVVFGTRFILFF